LNKKYTILLKPLLICIVLSSLILACSRNKTADGNKPPTQPEKAQTAAARPSVKKSFIHVEDFPIIKDSVKFMDDLRQLFDLEVDNDPSEKKKHKITLFEATKIYGSDKNCYFIEYDWKAGAMVSFPWRYQLLLREDGKLVKVFSGLRFDFLKIYQNQNPFLLILTSTSKGNGGHEIYRFTADTLENVLDGAVQTYDAHQDASVFEPSELKIEVKDLNHDHFNDLLFFGDKLMLGKYSEDRVWVDGENGKEFTVEHPAKRIAVKYEFLYDKQSGHFVESKYP
jgi:hypothetical protein